MQIQPGTASAAPIEKLNNPGGNPASIRSGITVDPAQTKASASSEVLERLLVQVVSKREDGLAQLRSLVNGTILNLQTTQNLKPGQLALVETRQTSGLKELTLQTQGRPLVEQILRLLAPHAGSLKAKLTEVAQLPTIAQQANPKATVGTSTVQTVGSRPAADPTTWLNQLLRPDTSGQRPTSAEAKPQAGNPIMQGLRALLSLSQQSGNAKPSGENQPGNPEAKTLGPGTLLQNLPNTSSIRDPAQVPPLLRGGQVPALLKLVLPLLQNTLQQTPVNSQQQQVRDAQLSAITQLAARILLGAVRGPNNGNEVEVSRNEWITRFDQSLDTLQVALHVIRENKHDEHLDRDANKESGGEKVRQWRVRLAFEFDELGLITAFVILNAERKLEVQFWTERASTRERLQQFRLQFRERLQTALDPHGVEQLDIGVFEGTPPPSTQQISTHLIDETA